MKLVIIELNLIVSAEKTCHTKQRIKNTKRYKKACVCEKSIIADLIRSMFFSPASFNNAYKN